MLRKTALAALLLAALAGCRAGKSFHMAIDAAQWSPEFKGSAVRSGGSNFDLVSEGGVASDETFWSIDVSTRLQSPRGGQVQPYTLNFGYWGHVYQGEGDAGTGLDFAGVTLTDELRTTAEFKVYKFSYEEPRPTQGSGRSGSQGVTAGLIGLHRIDFDIATADASGNVAKYADSAPVVVFGWKIAYFSSGLIYYFGAEGMDMDVVSIDNVGGNLLDTYAGVRWMIHGNTAALSFGYRKYEAELELRGDRINIELDGATFGLFLNW